MATEPKIVKYLDIPIQHCNSKILKLMNRRGDGTYLRQLFEKLNTLPVSYFDTHPVGDIVSRMISDADQFSDGLLLGFTQFFNGILTILGTIVFMLITNLKIGSVVFYHIVWMENIRPYLTSPGNIFHIAF